MIIGLAYLAILLSVPLARGRLVALADLPLRRPGLAVAAILVQILVISVIPGGDQTFHTTAHLFSYVLLGAFAFVNRRIPGLAIAAFGGLLNFIAISANGGVMPADPETIASFSHTTPDGEFANSQVLAHPKLLFLGDVIATPSSLPLHTVFSIGDLVLMLGVAVLVHVQCGSRLVPRARRRRRERERSAEVATA
jgi:hypothetical protein